MAVAGAAAILFLSAGCSPPEEPDAGPPMPKKVLFEGKVDAALVGKWSTKDGHSVIDLSSDGKANIVAVASTPGGKQKTEYAGEWLSTPDDLLLKYVVPLQGESTVKYAFKLAGSHLTLTSGIGTKTEYQKG